MDVDPDSHFPIQNLPYGVFSTPDNVSIPSIMSLSHNYTIVLLSSEMACYAVCLNGRTFIDGLKKEHNIQLINRP